jgi:8-oxo-dGTP pyrophosphatase MutT (NUDIX family)
MVDPREIRAWVEGFHPETDRRAAASCGATLALLEGPLDPVVRTSFAPGHVTASGVVLSHDGRELLLVFHRRLACWLQPGGHLEPADESIVEAARREVLEETGVALDERVAPALVGVDVHEIPAARGEPAHLHHDLMFRFVAADRPPDPIPEGERVAWCALDRLAAFGVDGPLLRAVERARRLPRGR